MIFDGDNKAGTVKALEEEQEQVPHDPPPTYTSVQSSSTIPSTSVPIIPDLGSASSSSYTPTNVVNYISISREHGHIKQSFTVDPSLYIPETLQLSAPVAKGELEGPRKNVRLQTVHGHILAEIALVQPLKPTANEFVQRANLHLSSSHGGIKVALPDSPYRPPFLLTAKSSQGNIYLTLPRSFTGPITVSYVHSKVKASALGEYFVTLSEANGKMKGFIGDLSKYTSDLVSDSGGKKGWKGDELVLDVKHGCVKLKFEQGGPDGADSVEEDAGNKKSLFYRIFGLS